MEGSEKVRVTANRESQNFEVKSSFTIPLRSIIKSFQEPKQMLPMRSAHKFKFYENSERRSLLYRKNI